MQSKGIPFESALAVSLNKRIWKKLNEEATLATKRLAVERGACPDYEDAVNCGVILEYGPVRNSHLFAVAPTASSSIIMGNTSPSVEPYRANIFVQKTLSGSHVWKNKFLERLLEKHGKNTQEVWDEIIANEGSVNLLHSLMLTKRIRLRLHEKSTSNGLFNMQQIDKNILTKHNLLTCLYQQMFLLSTCIVFT